MVNIQALQITNISFEKVSIGRNLYNQPENQNKNKNEGL